MHVCCQPRDQTICRFQGQHTKNCNCRVTCLTLIAKWIIQQEEERNSCPALNAQLKVIYNSEQFDLKHCSVSWLLLGAAASAHRLCAISAGLGEITRRQQPPSVCDERLWSHGTSARLIFIHVPCPFLYTRIYVTSHTITGLLLPSGWLALAESN